MKKLLTTIIGTTLLFGGCAGQKTMQGQVDDLTTQLTAVTEEKEKLEEHHEKDERHISFLCAMIGEESTADPMTGIPTVRYLGDLTFVHVPSGDVHTMPAMIEKCVGMAEDYEALIQARAASLLEKPKDEDPLGLSL